MRSLEKSKTEKKVCKARVEPAAVATAAVSPNHYTMRRTACTCKSDLFFILRHAIKTECSTCGTIAPADELPPECWQ